MKTKGTVTIWLTRDKKGSGSEDDVWIHSKKPELEDGVWVSENRTVYIVPPVKCGTKRRIILDLVDM